MFGAELARRASTWYGAGPPALRRQTRYAGAAIRPTVCPDHLENTVNYDVPCRPTPMPARAPMPAGWRRWSHGNDAAIYRSILGVERPWGMVLVERCCAGSASCSHCTGAEIVPG